MHIIDLRDLELNPGDLLDRVEAGECLVIERDGRPVAELRPWTPTQHAPRPIGLAAGEFTVPADFDAPLPDDLLKGFEGQ